MKPMLVRCMCVVAVVMAFAYAPAARAGATPEELFKDKGLTKVGTVLVTAQEAEVHAAVNSVRGLKAKVTSENLARANMARAVQTATDILVGLDSQLGSLDAEMKSLKKKPGEFNALVEPYNETVKQFRVRKANLDELRKKQGQIEDSQIPYSEAVVTGAKKAHAAAVVYATLAQDAALKAAIDAANKGATQPLKLGPSPSFLTDAAFLKKCAADMAAEGVPVRMSGGVPVVEVIINGLKHDMVWDSGASAVSISDDTAAELGLRVTSHERVVDATLADGRKVRSRLIVIPLIRVGAFTAENVECMVDFPGPVRGPDLLGGTFQRHFLCRLDQTAGVLHLTPIDKQAGESPAPLATSTPFAAPTPVATATPAAPPLVPTAAPSAPVATPTPPAVPSKPEALIPATPSTPAGPSSIFDTPPAVATTPKPPKVNAPTRPPAVAPPAVVSTPKPPVVVPPTTPAVVAPPVRPPVTTAQGPVDLLPLVDLTRDSLEAGWTPEAGGFKTDGKRARRLLLPYEPPEEYDLLVESTRISGRDSQFITLPAPGAILCWNMGQKGQRLFFDHKDRIVVAAQDDPSIDTPNRPLATLIKVRRDGVEVLVNGKQVVDYHGPFADVNTNKFGVKNQKTPGIGSWTNAAIVYTRVQVTPISGSGRIVNPGHTPAPSPSKADPAVAPPASVAGSANADIAVDARRNEDDPLATGVMVSAGQTFSIVPNPNDTWTAGGRSHGKPCDYRGYDGNGGWMSLKWRVGNAKSRIISGENVVAPESGEIKFFSQTVLHNDTTGIIHVRIVVGSGATAKTPAAQPPAPAEPARPGESIFDVPK